MGKQYSDIVYFVNELLDTYKNTEEKSIQLYPSPEFLNSLSFIKKFYPTPRWGEGKFTKITHEIIFLRMTTDGTYF